MGFLANDETDLGRRTVTDLVVVSRLGLGVADCCWGLTVVVLLDPILEFSGTKLYEDRS